MLPATAGVVDDRLALPRRASIYEFGHVLHELQLNAWVLAYRRQLGDAVPRRGRAETTIEPPADDQEERARASMRFRRRLARSTGLRDVRARGRSARTPSIELDRGERRRAVTRCSIEFDRTRRVDKNYEKFRRYDTFLELVVEPLDRGARRARAVRGLRLPRREHQLGQFLHAADYELTGCQPPYWPRLQPATSSSAATGSSSPSSSDMHAWPPRRAARARGPARPPEPRQAPPRAYVASASQSATESGLERMVHSWC